MPIPAMPEKRAQALALLRGGMKQADVARKLGVTGGAVCKWAKKGGGTAPPPATAPTSATVPEILGKLADSVKPVQPPGSQSDFEKAMQAAGIPLTGKQPDAPKVGPTGIPDCPPGYMLVDGKPVKESDALVGLVELVNGTAVKLYATLNGVKLDKALLKELEITPIERAELALAAPYAVPFVRKLLDKAELIGAVIFAGAVVVIIGSRLSIIKERIPKKTKPVAEGKPDQSPPASPPTQNNGAVPERILIPGIDRPATPEDWAEHGIDVT